MTTLQTFITSWEETDDIAAVLDSGLSLPPNDEVQSHLASLPDAEQAAIRTKLTQIMTELEAYAANMIVEQAETKAQIDQSVKNVRACLSYGTADNIRKK